MTRIQLWNGDIRDLEVDAIVSLATPSPWMSTGVGRALKEACGDPVAASAIREVVS